MNSIQEFNDEEEPEEIPELDPNITKVENCFELPDETTIEFHEKCLNFWGDMLISNDTSKLYFDHYVPSLLDNINCFKMHQDLFLVTKLELKNLHEYLFDCFEFCDRDFCNKMSNKILLTGGASQTSGLFDQLKYVI